MKKKVVALSIMTLMAVACQQGGSSSKQEQQMEDVKETSMEKTEEKSVKQEVAFSVVGDYASDEYAKRAEGYDWVGVRISELESGELKVLVRSRADIKKPTCTFDGTAQKVGDNVYQVDLDGTLMKLTFTEKDLTISAESPEGVSADEDTLRAALSYYCSGGATLKGTYQKQSEPISEAKW